MERFAAFLLMLGVVAGPAVPARADVTYTITLTDEQAATVSTQTDKLNAERRASKGSPPDITPTQLLKNVILGTVGHWGVAHEDQQVRDQRGKKK